MLESYFIRPVVACCGPADQQWLNATDRQTKSPAQRRALFASPPEGNLSRDNLGENPYCLTNCPTCERCHSVD
jgi:hypothetical protein